MGRDWYAQPGDQIGKPRPFNENRVAHVHEAPGIRGGIASNNTAAKIRVEINQFLRKVARNRVRLTTQARTIPPMRTYRGCVGMVEVNTNRQKSQEAGSG